MFEHKIRDGRVEANHLLFPCVLKPVKNLEGLKLSKSAFVLTRFYQDTAFYSKNFNHTKFILSVSCLQA